MSKASRERRGRDSYERRAANRGSNSGNRHIWGANGNGEPLPTEPFPIAVYDLLAWWGTQDGGYLKLVPDFTGNCTWCYWKYSDGEFPGCYILYCAPFGDILGGLEGLRTKHNEVAAGTRKPTPDRWKPQG